MKYTNQNQHELFTKLSTVMKMSPNYDHVNHIDYFHGMLRIIPNAFKDYRISFLRLLSNGLINLRKFID